MADEPIKKRRGNPAFSKKKGEPGYIENRDTVTGQLARSKAAHEAVSIFPHVEDFQKVADDYFDECDERGVLYGEAGLALYLSEHNKKGRTVTLTVLRSWYDGDRCAYLQDAVQMAYLRIQNQVETDERYREKGMVTRGISSRSRRALAAIRTRSSRKTTRRCASFTATAWTTAISSEKGANSNDGDACGAAGDGCGHPRGDVGAVCP